MIMKFTSLKHLRAFIKMDITVHKFSQVIDYELYLTEASKGISKNILHYSQIQPKELYKV